MAREHDFVASDFFWWKQIFSTVPDTVDEAGMTNLCSCVFYAFLLAPSFGMKDAPCFWSFYAPSLLCEGSDRCWETFHSAICLTDNVEGEDIWQEI